MQKLKEEVREKIIKAGIVRFKLEGYEKASMKSIASDAGISIGNIYRYFLTKKHILNEILVDLENEIEAFFKEFPSTYSEINMHNLFKSLSDLTVKIATNNNDTLKIMFNSPNEKQFIDFKENVLKLFTDKIVTIAKSIETKKNLSYILCEAVARGVFEGFMCIVKNYIDDTSELKKNLEIYNKLMIENLDKRVMDVI